MTKIKYKVSATPRNSFSGLPNVDFEVELEDIPLDEAMIIIDSYIYANWSGYGILDTEIWDNMEYEYEIEVEP